MDATDLKSTPNRPSQKQNSVLTLFQETTLCSKSMSGETISDQTEPELLEEVNRLRQRVAELERQQEVVILSEEAQQLEWHVEGPELRQKTRDDNKLLTRDTLMNTGFSLSRTPQGLEFGTGLFQPTLALIPRNTWLFMGVRMFTPCFRW
jgi:hypothetical protein